MDKRLIFPIVSCKSKWRLFIGEEKVGGFEKLQEDELKEDHLAALEIKWEAFLEKKK